jgi:hypothetical protein
MSESIGFRLQLTCDNAAFDDEPAIEVARILRDLAAQLERGEDFSTYTNLRDINGNIVGVAKLAPVSRL